MTDLTDFQRLVHDPLKKRYDSLRLELEACRHNHIADNEFLIGERDRYRAALERIANLPYGMATVEGTRRVAREALKEGATE